MVSARREYQSHASSSSNATPAGLQGSFLVRDDWDHRFGLFLPQPRYSGRSFGYGREHGWSDVSRFRVSFSEPRSGEEQFLTMVSLRSRPSTETVPQMSFPPFRPSDRIPSRWPSENSSEHHASSSPWSSAAWRSSSPSKSPDGPSSGTSASSPCPS